MEKRNVYLDNNAATRTDERVVSYMNHYHLNDYAVATEGSPACGDMETGICDFQR